MRETGTLPDIRSNSYEGDVYSPDFWSNSYSNVYSLIVYSPLSFFVILQGHFWSSSFGHVNNPQYQRKTFDSKILGPSYQYDYLN